MLRMLAIAKDPKIAWRKGQSKVWEITKSTRDYGWQSSLIRCIASRQALCQIDQTLAAGIQWLDSIRACLSNILVACHWQVANNVYESIADLPKSRLGIATEHHDQAHGPDQAMVSGDEAVCHLCEE
jgi:hypothetical protein